MSVKNYGWDAKDYAANSTNQFSWAQELIAKLGLAGCEAVLDVGCGDGRITSEIACSVPDGVVVGIDSSPTMISLANNMFPSGQYPNLSFRLMDARQLAFNGEFDVAFSNAALHWVINQESVLAGVCRSLKRGGRLLFQMGGKGNAAAMLEVVEDLITQEQYRGYFTGFYFPYAFFAPEEYSRLLIQAGLKPVRVELISKDMKFQDAEGLTGWIRTTWLPYTQRIPEKFRDHFIKEITGNYLKRHPKGSDGAIHMEMKRLEVEAEKP